MIKTEDEDDGDAEVDVESDTTPSENHENRIEPPRRRDSSDPVNLSINSGASTTSDSSREIVHRLESSLRNCLDETGKYRENNCDSGQTCDLQREQRFLFFSNENIILFSLSLLSLLNENLLKKK